MLDVSAQGEAGCIFDAGVIGSWGERPHILYPYVPLIYEWFYFRNAIPRSLLSFFSKEEWKVAKEEVAGQAKKDLSAGRPAAQFVIPFHIQCGLNDRETIMPGQYKLQDASGRPACCGSEEPHRSFFLMAGRNPGAPAESA